MKSKKGKVLVIGGTGYIGIHTAWCLRQAGYGVVLLDNYVNSRPQAHENLCSLLDEHVPMVVGDACDEKILKEAIDKEGPLVGSIHFAALKSVPESCKHPLSYYKNNLTSMLNLLGLACGSVVFSSSASVYGDLSSPAEESMPMQPISPYGHTKQLGEVLLESACKERALQGISLRYFNPIGAHPSAVLGEWPLRPSSNLVPCLLHAIRHKQAFKVYGTDYDTLDGSCVRSYLHVMDLAEAHVAALDWLLNQKPGTYEVVNCGTGKGDSVLEMVAIMERVCALRIAVLCAGRRDGDVATITAQTEKVERLLNWRCTRSLEQALSDAWRWEQKMGHLMP